MFSGKSTELLKRIRKSKKKDKAICIISHVIDTRYQVNRVCSHDKDFEESHIVCSHLYKSSIFKTIKFINASHVFIEEAQFFPDLLNFCKYAVTTLNKNLIVSGLDGDYNMEPFMNIVSLVPFADKVIKLKAKCMICNDDAHFTKLLKKHEIEDGNNNIIVGGTDKYMCVCRVHH